MGDTLRDKNLSDLRLDVKVRTFCSCFLAAHLWNLCPSPLPVRLTRPWRKGGLNIILHKKRAVEREVPRDAVRDALLSTLRSWVWLYALFIEGPGRLWLGNSLVSCLVHPHALVSGSSSSSFSLILTLVWCPPLVLTISMFLCSDFNCIYQIVLIIFACFIFTLDCKPDCEATAALHAPPFPSFLHPLCAGIGLGVCLHLFFSSILGY